MDPKGVDEGGGVAPAARPTLLTLLDSEPGAFSFFVWKSVVIACWLDRGTGPFVDRLTRVTVPLVVASPKKLSFVHMVEHGVGLPTSEGRAGFTAMMDRHGDQLGCVAVVLLGVGFWASAFQGAITGMHMLSPRSFPLRIESRLDTAARWLAPAHLARTQAFLDANELASALTEARASTAAAARRTTEALGPTGR